MFESKIEFAVEWVNSTNCAEISNNVHFQHNKDYA